MHGSETWPVRKTSIMFQERLTVDVWLVRLKALDLEDMERSWHLHLIISICANGWVICMVSTVVPSTFHILALNDPDSGGSGRYVFLTDLVLAQPGWPGRTRVDPDEPGLTWRNLGWPGRTAIKWVCCLCWTTHAHELQWRMVAAHVYTGEIKFS